MALKAIDEYSISQPTKIDTDDDGVDDEPCFFNLLPPEMIEKILFKLRSEDYRASRLVNSQWCEILERKLCMHFKLTTKSLIKFYRDNLPSLDKLSVDMEQIFVRSIIKTKRAKEVLAEVSELSFDASIRIPRIDADWDRKSIEQYSARISREFYFFLKTCYNLHVLILNFRNTSDKLCMNLTLRDHPILYLNNLQTIELCVPLRNDLLLLTVSLGRLVTPSLCNLRLEHFCKDDENLRASSGIRMVWLLMYLQRHQTSLKSLELVNTVFLVETDRYVETNFLKDGKLQLHKLTVCFDHEQFPDENIILENGNLQEKWSWSSITQLLQIQNCIQELKISTNSPKLLNLVTNLLERNVTTLRSLQLYLFGSSIANVDCSKLKPLTSLAHLDLGVEAFSTIELRNMFQLPCSLETLYWNAPYSDFLAFAKQRVPAHQSKKKYPNLRRIIVRRPPAREYLFLPSLNPRNMIFPMIPQLSSVTKRSCVT